MQSDLMFWKEKIAKIYLDRNKEYGDCWKSLGIKGSFVSINGKYYRIIVKVKNSGDIKDTLCDLVNYCIISNLFLYSHEWEGTDGENNIYDSILNRIVDMIYNSEYLGELDIKECFSSIELCHKSLKESVWDNRSVEEEIVSTVLDKSLRHRIENDLLICGACALRWLTLCSNK